MLALRDRCLRLFEEKRFAEALGACEEFVARFGLDQPLETRLALADVMWIACMATAQESVALTGERGAAAMRDLDALLEWLGDQPESDFQNILAWRLADKMRWLGARQEAIGALGELMTLVNEIDDAAITRDIADRIITEGPWLFYIGSDDFSGIVEVLVEELDATGGTFEDPTKLPKPAQSGISQAAIVRSERLHAAFDDLAERLQDDDHPEAPELHALALIHLATALVRLGRGEEAEAILEQVIALGPASVAACDRLIAQEVELKGDGLMDDPATRSGMMLMKATVLEEIGDTEAAIAAYTDVIDQFAEESNPLIASFVQAAREARHDLTTDDR
jgi:tetratricopeptide (TPR) repeat protein